jgi:hypothetical protein
VILSFCCSASAQQTSPADQETITLLKQEIAQLQEHQRGLEARIAALEGSQTHGTESNRTNETPPAEGTKADANSLQDEIHELRGIQWRGFAEADYKALNRREPETGTNGFVPGSAGNFYTGDFDLFLTSRVGDRASALAEIDFQEGDAQRYNVDVRRLLLNYHFNDRFKFSFGRYQTGIGYYNWAFRSAAWLQTAADRPLVMEYASNGGILPTQAIGVSLTGTFPSGRLGLNYIAEYGSSDTIRPDINGDGLLNDENNGNHVNFGLFARPDRWPGLQIGASFYHDQISDLTVVAPEDQIVGVPPDIPTAPTSPLSRWNQTIVNGYAVYVSGRAEFLNEAFLIRHSLIGESSLFNTPAFYSQFSRKVGAWRPFIRYQYVNAAARNAVYDDIGRREGPSVGVRYDLGGYLAFKAQMDHTIRRGLPDLNGLHLQVAAAF